jgi:hypothetical protein
LASWTWFRSGYLEQLAFGGAEGGLDVLRLIVGRVRNVGRHGNEMAPHGGLMDDLGVVPGIGGARHRVDHPLQTVAASHLVQEVVLLQPGPHRQPVDGLRLCLLVHGPNRRKQDLMLPMEHVLLVEDLHHVGDASGIDDHGPEGGRFSRQMLGHGPNPIGFRGRLGSLLSWHRLWHRPVELLPVLGVGLAGENGIQRGAEPGRQLGLLLQDGQQDLGVPLAFDLDDLIGGRLGAGLQDIVFRVHRVELPASLCVTAGVLGHGLSFLLYDLLR